MAGVLAVNMPELFNIINYVSVAKYFTSTAAVIAFQGLKIECDKPPCPFATGEQVLENYNIHPEHKHFWLGMLGGLAAAFRIGAYILLRLRKPVVG